MRKEEVEARERGETTQVTEPTTTTRGTARETRGYFGHVLEVFGGTSEYQWSDQLDRVSDARVI